MFGFWFQHPVLKNIMFTFSTLFFMFMIYFILNSIHMAWNWPHSLVTFSSDCQTNHFKKHTTCTVPSTIIIPFSWHIEILSACITMSNISHYTCIAIFSRDASRNKSFLHTCSRDNKNVFYNFKKFIILPELYYIKL